MACTTWRTRWRHWRYAAPWLCRLSRCCRPCVEFRGLPHRMEKVAAFSGVTFYDDSKGTNVGATVAALNGMAQTCGFDSRRRWKGSGFLASWRTPVAEHARAVVLIGRDAGKIADAIQRFRSAIASRGDNGRGGAKKLCAGPGGRCGIDVARHVPVSICSGITFTAPRHSSRR